MKLNFGVAMSEQLILEKLENLEKQSNKLDQKVDKIEVAVGLIAVQSERINGMQKQLQTLWAKHDEVFGSTGVINQMRQFQASCPKRNFQKALNQQWVAIGLLATLLSGCLLKIMKVL